MKTTATVSKRNVAKSFTTSNHIPKLKKQLYRNSAQPKTSTVISHSTIGCAQHNVGTVDQVIQEGKLFKASGKMPNVVLSCLLENGWIGRLTDDAKSVKTVSLHKNMQRANVVSKKYDAGLIWLDEKNFRLDWTKLDSSVIVNRFPRNSSVLKLCSSSMVTSKCELFDEPGPFDKFFPRTYATDMGNSSNQLVIDFSLTSCISILRFFVSEERNVKFAKNGEVPLSTIRFALSSCQRFIVDGVHSEDFFIDNESDWATFFENIHKSINCNKAFLVSEDHQEILEELKEKSRSLLKTVWFTRPQTSIDGYNNFWIVKSKYQTNENPILLNKLEDITSLCLQLNNTDYVVQKYIETPLLSGNNTKFSINTWIVVSTLDDRLTVWLYQTCCIRYCLHEFTLSNGLPFAHYTNPKSKLTLHPTISTCSFKRLKRELKKAGIKKKFELQALVSKIRKAIVTAVTANLETLNCRPNCVELFRASFVLAEDFHPWLIEIESDSTLSYKSRSVSGVPEGLSKGFIEIIINKCKKSKIGMYDLIHESSIPQGFEPCAYVYEKIAAYKRFKSFVLAEQTINEESGKQPAYGWDSFDLIGGTYMEEIPMNNEVDDELKSETIKCTTDLEIKANVTQKVLPVRLSLADLKESMTRLKTGSKIDSDEATRCLILLDKWKTRVSSIQSFYKKVLVNNMNH
ncbi:tubulin glycylase 3A-like [Adelges cooleyi]|uniref:tubulin glycylase 3A-like n=1 Tax=Adelges cooleyi TaxID=133065 RepID=UPI002180068C|nr:tubulin glycylase 3A-like [Adelges cooleyi]